MQRTWKHKTGDPIPYLGELSERQVNALRAQWAGTANKEQSNEAATAIRELKEMGAWIACDCRNDGIIPILYPRQYITGRYGLVRAPGHGEHSDECPFRWEEGSIGKRKTGGAIDDHSSIEFLPSYEIDEDDSKQTPGKVKQREGSANNDAIARRMFWMLEQAGLDRWDAGEERTHKRDLERLREELKRIHLNANITIDDIVWNNQKWITEGWGNDRLDRYRKSGEWPEGRRKQGWLLITVNGSDKQIINGRHPITVQGRITHCGGKNELSGGPYLALIHYAAEEGGDIKAMRAYLHPVTNDAIMLVDSGYERDALSTLIWTIEKVMERTGLKLQIQKPLKDIEAGVRPDFMLNGPNGARLIIETMGSDDHEYRDRKARTHQAMARYGTLVLDERVGIDKREAGSKLSKAVFAWVRGLT